MKLKSLIYNQLLTLKNFARLNKLTQVGIAVVDVLPLGRWRRACSGKLVRLNSQSDAVFLLRCYVLSICIFAKFYPLWVLV